jgi:DNA polymerase-3 subunit gamma/tau
VVIDEDDLPKEPVTQAALDEAWKIYTTRWSKGEKIMASILQMDQPKLLKGHHPFI